MAMGTAGDRRWDDVVCSAFRPLYSIRARVSHLQGSTTRAIATGDICGTRALTTSQTSECDIKGDKEMRRGTGPNSCYQARGQNSTSAVVGSVHWRLHSSFRELYWICKWQGWRIPMPCSAQDRVADVWYLKGSSFLGDQEFTMYSDGFTDMFPSVNADELRHARFT